MDNFDFYFLINLGRHSVKLLDNKAIHNFASGRPSRPKLALEKSLAIGVSNLPIFIRSVYSIATYSVPIVQRKEQGFPKAKRHFCRNSLMSSAVRKPLHLTS